MVRLIEEKTVQLGKVTPTLNKSLVDYAKLIGITKIDLLEELIYKELEGRVLTKGFIIPEKPFYFNLEELLTEGTVKASINKPSTDFNKYYTVKKIANNLDSKNSNFRTYCYNDNKALHKGIFIYYIFSREAKPVPLVMDYNIESNELTISLIKLSDLTLLIENEEDVVTVENILKTTKENIETYSYLADKDVDFIEDYEEGNWYIKFMDSITGVIEDFKGRKMIDLLKYNVNEFDNPLAEDVVKYSYVGESIKTEDIFKKLIQQEQELQKVNSKLEVFEGIRKEVEEISKWFIMKEEEPERYKEERAKLWNELKQEGKED